MNKEQELLRLRDAADEANETLALYVSDMCPVGPHHLVRKRRDGKPAWCPHCGRDNRGVVRR